MLRRLQCRMYATDSQLVRWFRAVDEPVSKPKPFNYKPTKPPSKFEAFSPLDSGRLENAFSSGKSHEIVESDGLLTVNFAHKTCAPTYYDGPAFAVRRALWFEQLNPNKFNLADEAIERALEEKYLENPDAQSFNIHVPDPVNKGSKGKRFQGSFSSSDASTVRAMIQEDDSWLSMLTKRDFIRGAPMPKPIKSVKSQCATGAQAMSEGILKPQMENRSDPEKISQAEGTPIPAQQPPQKPPVPLELPGIKHFNVRPQYTPRNINHLIFCIHGIGQLLSLRYEQVNFVKDVDQFRRELNKAHKNTKPVDENNGIQVLPVMWRHGLDDTINGLHPQQLFGSVNVAADVVLDFVMYMEEQHRHRILHTAAEKMRKMYHKFCENNPHFAANPKVSIVGHSLGSVIAHDLVSRSDEELPFDVTNLFTMGSPVGILELMRHSQTIDKGKASNMYNILRRADPVAARLEPIVERQALEVAPRPLPGGGTNLLKQLKDFTEEVSDYSGIWSTKASTIWNTMMTRDKCDMNSESATSEQAEKEPEKKPTPEEAVDLSALNLFNRHGRLDFSVTETMDISLVLGLAGHLMYFDNEDIAAFVLKETLEL